MVALRGAKPDDLPITEGSLSSDVVQKRWVSTAAPAASGSSSAAFSRRPSTGCSPITSKYEPFTTPACTTRGSPRPISVKSIVENSPKALIECARDLQVVDLGDRERGVRCADARGALTDVDQPVLVAIDQRPQQHAAHHAEDGGVGADAERKRNDDRCGETLGTQQGAEPDPHVLGERRHGIDPAGVPDAAHRIANARDVAELPSAASRADSWSSPRSIRSLMLRARCPRISSSRSRSSGRTR